MSGNEIINTDQNQVSNENFNESLKKDFNENFGETIKIDQSENIINSNVYKNEILEKKSSVNTNEISTKDQTEIQNSDIKKTKPPIRVTYYLNNFDKHYNVFYGETKEKNRITYMKSFNEYQDQNRCEYYFNHRISLDKVDYTNKTTIDDIFESVKKYFGCILNFGNKKHFEPVYMDFIDDYKILLKIIK